MRRYIWTAVALLVVLALPFAVAPRLTERVWEHVVHDRGDELRIGTSLAGSDYHQIGAVLAELLAPGLTIVPVETQGSLENLERLRAGDLDFALVQGWLEVDPGAVRTLAAIADERVQVVVPEGSDIERMADLAGGRLLVAAGGSASRRLAENLTRAYRFDPPVVLVEGRPPFAADLAAGRADAAFFVARLGAPPLERLLAGGRHRLIPIRSARALSQVHVDVMLSEIPSGVYGANRSVPSESLPTIAVRTNLIAHAETEGVAVRAVLEAIFSTSFARLAGIPRVTEEAGLRLADPPIHEAAIDFYRRDEPVSSDEFEIAAFFLALAISAIGLYRYIADRRHAALVERRRKRIRPYFEALVACDEELHDAEGEEAIAILDRMRRLHREAEQRWLSGELDTEDMENFYVRYSTFTQNAYNQLRVAQGRGEAAT